MPEDAWKYERRVLEDLGDAINDGLVTTWLDDQDPVQLRKLLRRVALEHDLMHTLLDEVIQPHR